MLSGRNFLVIGQVFIDHLRIFRVDRPFPIQSGREAVLFEDDEYLDHGELGLRQGTGVGVRICKNLGHKRLLYNRSFGSIRTGPGIWACTFTHVSEFTGTEIALVVMIFVILRIEGCVDGQLYCG